MDENKSPKKRVIFDESLYYGNEGAELAVENLVEREDLTRDEVRKTRSDSELFEHAMEMRDFDYKEEMDALKAYLGGKPSAMSSKVSEHGGNPVIVSGTIGRWDGARSGFTVFDNFDELMHGQDSPFKDCEIQKVWDENGHLFIHGTHHDGSVTVELRQLSDAGAEAYEAISDAWVGEPFEANGKTYDGSDRSLTEAVRDLWEATEPPRYMERAFGCPAVEWNAPEVPKPCLDLYVGQWRVHLIRPVEALGLGLAEDSEYDLHPGRFAGEGMVQFYDISRSDQKNPMGELVGQFSLGNLVTPNRGGGLSVLALYPRNQIGMKQHVTGDALRAVDAWARSSYKSLGGRLPEREPEKAPEHAVSLKDAEQASRSAAEALAGNKSVDAPARAEQTI